MENNEYENYFIDGRSVLENIFIYIKHLNG